MSLSFVPVWYSSITKLVSNTNTLYRVRAYALEPESRARVLRARVSDLNLSPRFVDGRYAVNPRTSSRTRAIIRVARLQRLYWYSRGIKCNSNTSARVYIILLFLYHWYVKSSNLCIIPLSIFFIFEGKYYRIDRLTVMRSRVMVRQATHAPS